MRKKSIQIVVALLLAGVLLFQPLSFVTRATDFSGHWAEEYITQLSDAGIVQGDQQGRVNPENSITRAEFIALVVRSFSFTEGTGEEAGFPDVASGRWYYNYFAIARAEGLVQGDNRGNANPATNITRAEAAVLLSRVSGFTATASVTEFVDNDDIANWAMSGVVAMVENNVIGGFPDGSFRPSRNLTRAEAFTLIARLVGRDADVVQPVVDPIDLDPPADYDEDYDDDDDDNDEDTPATTTPASRPATQAPPSGGGGGGAGGGGGGTVAPRPAIITDYFNIDIVYYGGGVSFVLLEALANPVRPIPPRTQLNFLLDGTVYNDIWNRMNIIDGVRQYRLGVMGTYSNVSQMSLQYR